MGLAKHPPPLVILAVVRMSELSGFPRPENIVRETLSGELNRTLLVARIDALVDRLGQGECFLINLCACDFALSSGEFMAVIDTWFERLGTTAPTALVFHPENHRDQAMLFETKGFLLGSRLKTFTSEKEAASWLAERCSLSYPG